MQVATQVQQFSGVPIRGQMGKARNKTQLVLVVVVVVVLVLVLGVGVIFVLASSTFGCLIFLSIRQSGPKGHPYKMINFRV